SNALCTWIDVPNHLGSRREIVGPLRGHFGFGCITIVAFAAHLDRKTRRALNETHRIATVFSPVKRGIGRKRLPARGKFGDGIANSIPISTPLTCRPGMAAETD